MPLCASPYSTPKEFRGRIRCLEWCPTRDVVAVLDVHGELRVMRVWEPVRTWSSQQTHEADMVAWSPDGAFVSAICSTGSVATFDVESPSAHQLELELAEGETITGAGWHPLPLEQQRKGLRSEARRLIDAMPLVEKTLNGVFAVAEALGEGLVKFDSNAKNARGAAVKHYVLAKAAGDDALYTLGELLGASSASPWLAGSNLAGGIEAALFALNRLLSSLMRLRSSICAEADQFAKFIGWMLQDDAAVTLPDDIRPNYQTPDGMHNIICAFFSAMAETKKPSGMVCTTEVIYCGALHGYEA
nr:hypothetical protein HK105_005136 [Polyrhizophydium stewartii]